MFNNRIDPTRIQGADFKRGVHRLDLHKECSKDDILDPEKWTEIAAIKENIRVGDKIEILREDFAFYAEVIVMTKNGSGIKVKLINLTELEDTKPESQGSLQILWKGPQKKYTVVRESDGKERKDGFANKEEAFDWIKNNS